jgi:hypothetical protein
MKVAEAEARKAVYVRSRGRCEGCGGTATDYSHRRTVAVRGQHQWCPCNALHLCRTCHRWAHDNPEAARERGWHVSRYVDDPGTVPAVTIAGTFILDCEGGGSHLPGVGTSR